MTSFSDFMIKNGIITTAAAITVGFATVTFIKSFVIDMVLPLIFLIVVGGSSKISKSAGDFFSQFLQSKDFRFTNFVAEAITYILIIIASYLVLEYVVNRTIQRGWKLPNITMSEMIPESVQQYNPFATKPIQVLPQQQPVVVASIPTAAPPPREIKENYQSRYSNY